MKRFLLLILVLFICFTSYSQGKIKKKRTLNENVFLGGGLGLQFGSFTGIEISPMGGYKPIDDMYTGVKLTYQHISTIENEIVQNVYGGSIFAEYVIFDKIIGHVEFETLSIHEDYLIDRISNTRIQEQFWYSAPLVGGGLYQEVGYRSALIVMALFDVSGSSKTIYNNPIIRITFLF